MSLVQQPHLLPQADEFATGYDRRLMAAHGVPRKWPDIAMWIYIRTHSLREHTTLGGIQELALETGSTLDDFVARHTLAPALCTFLNAKEPENFYEQEQMFGKNALRLPRSGPQACPVCAREDRARLGFSYWRRLHQLPGVVYCPTHLVALHSFEPNSLYEQPHEACGAAAVRQVRPRFLEETLTQIWMGLLELPAPLSASAVHPLICAGLKRQKLSGNSAAGAEDIRSRLVKQADPQWLAQYFGAAKTIYGPVRAGADRAAPKWYALTLALLYQGAVDELLYSLRSVIDAGRTHQQSGATPPQVQRALYAFGTGAPVADAIKISGTSEQAFLTKLRQLARAAAGGALQS